MSKLKFVIVSPTQRGGGSIVLHELCKLLNDRGYNSKIFYAPCSVRSNCNVVSWVEIFVYKIKNVIRYILCCLLAFTPLSKYERYSTGCTYKVVKGCRHKILPFVDSDTVVIYPEVVYGNFLKAKNVVRYLLYHYQYSGDNNAYSPNDLFICYRKYFNDNVLNPDKIKLGINIFDVKLYKNRNSKSRAGKCYIVRKGKKRPDIPDSFDGPVIDALSEPEIAKLFNRCKYCISYDTQTAYTMLAAYSGCIPIVIPEPGKSRFDYCGPDEIHYGIAYGDSKDEIAFAIQTRDKVVNYLGCGEHYDEKELQDFVSLCENRFGNNVVN